MEYKEYYKTEVSSDFFISTLVDALHIKFDKLYEGEAHDFTELMYIAQGKHSVELDGVSYELAEGEMIMFPPRSFHNSQKVSNAYIAYISFETRSEKIRELYSKVIPLNLYQRELLSSVVLECERLLTKVPSELGVNGKMPSKDVEGYRLQAIKNKIELILIDIYSSIKEKKQSLGMRNTQKYKECEFDLILNYLRSRISEKLTLEDMGNGTGMSVSKLKRIFKELGYTSPSAFFNELKINEAKRLIRESSMNFTQIAERLGFSSVHYFSNAFKKQTNMTPSEYAQQST